MRKNLILFGFVFFAISFKKVKLLKEKYTEDEEHDICQFLDPRCIVDFLNRSFEQHSFCPFHIETSCTILEIADVVNLQVTSDKRIPFLGFLMRPLNRDIIRVTGKFLPKEGVQLLNCLGRRQNTLIHYDGKYKTSYNVSWEAPFYDHGETDFYLTVIQDRYTYWRHFRATWIQVVDDIKRYMPQ